MQKIKRWINMRTDESITDYALRVTNDGRVIAIWFVIASAIIAFGIVLALIP